MNLRIVKTIARKEFYHLMRDFRSLYLAFFIPLLLILLFGYALSLDVDRIKTAVVDHDNTPASRDLIRHLGASTYFTVFARPKNQQALTDLLDHGRTTMGIVIPPGWTGRIRSDQEAPLQVLFDGSDPNFASISRGYIEAFVDEYNRKQLAAFLNRMGREPIQPPVEGRIRIWFNEDLESRRFIVPGIIAIIIMIVGAMLTSLVIAREYENGTMETIRSLPIRAEELLLGKALPYFFIALADVLISILMGQILFGVVMKSLFSLMLLGSCLYLAVALNLGLLISTITKSQLVANQVAVLATYLPSLLLSDFVFPISNMPEILQKITYLVPARYYIDILNGLYLRNIGMERLWESYAVLLIMASVLALLNLAALRKEGL